MQKLLRTLLITACFATIIGCSEQADNASTERDAQRPIIALVTKSLANEFFITMADGARAHHASNQDKYDLIVNGIRNETDLAAQVALIDQMIASRVDAIVIAPADSKAMVPALARAAAAGIVIVNIDNRLDEEILGEYGLSISFVGPDNFQGAEMVATYLAERLDSGQKVAILEGVPTTYNSQQRTAGFEKAMRDGDLNIVAKQSAQWDQTTAVTVASGMLVQHPDLAAILAANDNMALGAVAAINQAGKAGDIAVIGFDNISAVQALVRDGTILATASQHADLLAVYGIEHALESIQSNVAPADRATPVDLITADALD
jgi:ribose transport system substrate-binding protein